MFKLGLSVLKAGSIVFVTALCLFSQSSPNSLPFTLSPGAATSFVSCGPSGPLNTGFAGVLMDAGNTAPDGFALFQFRSNSVLVSEAAVPASALSLNKELFVEVVGNVTTGVAIANPNEAAATISFDFQDPLIRFRGGGVNPGTVTIPAKSQIAGFINEPPFNNPAPYFGLMRFVSSIPVAVTSLRGLRNERSEFIMTAVNESDTSRQRGSNVLAPQAVVGYLPLIVEGGGWTTELVLRNPDFDDAAAGTLDFRDPNGNPLPLTINGQTTSTLRYEMQRSDFLRVSTSGAGSNIRVGSIRVTADAHSFAPGLFAIYSFKPAGVTVSTASAPMVESERAFRLYVEESGDYRGQLQTGIVIHNASALPSSVLLQLTDLNGNAIGFSSTVTIPGFGQISKFFREIPEFAAMPFPFRGVLRFRTDTSEGITVQGIRGRYNERSDFLITSILPSAESEEATEPVSQLAFPHVAEGSGYSTGFVLFNDSASPSSGNISGVLRNGVPMNICETSFEF
jgi:hypothetical protein